MIDRISATLIMVRDFDESLRFYRDVLQFEPSTLEKGFAAFDIGDKTLAILDLSMAVEMISREALQPEKPFIPRSLFAVFMDDCDAEYERLKTRGVRFIKAPVTQPWGQRTAYFADPDGHIWEISHFPKEA